MGDPRSAKIMRPGKPRAGPLRIALHLMPVAVPLVLLFGGGLGMGIAQSTGAATPVSTHVHGFAAYRDLLSDTFFLKSLAYSLYVGFASALLSVTIGTVVAYFIWRLPPRLRGHTIAYKIPLVLPHIAVAFIIVLVFSRTGIISSLLFQLKMIGSEREFPRILYSGNGAGLIIAYVYKEVPFVVLMTLSVLQRLDARLFTTARVLGASRIRTFHTVVLPFIGPAVSSTFIILFLYGFGAFDIPFILGESDPQMLPVYVYSLYFQRNLELRPYAMAALTIVFAVSFLFIIAYAKLVARISEETRRL